jgi:virulence-associated protein VapD
VLAKESKRRYAINFDLSVKLLEEFYSDTNPRKAYSEINDYMLSHGFVHRQWSGYISEGTMSRPQLLQLTMELHDFFPWLINCETSMDVTVITDIFDIKQMIIDSVSDKVDMSNSN